MTIVILTIIMFQTSIIVHSLPWPINIDRRHDYASLDKRTTKLKLMSTEETEGQDFMVEGNVLFDVLLDVRDDELLDVTYYTPVQGH